MQELKRVSSSVLGFNEDGEQASKRSKADTQILSTAAEDTEQCCANCQTLEGRLVDLQVQSRRTRARNLERAL